MKNCEIILCLISCVVGWQLVEELCASKLFDRKVLPADCCSVQIPRCEWKNITCDANGELFSLQLFNVFLGTNLPETIDAPGPSIHTLKLVNCGLRGTVPRTIDQVSSLKILDLSNNQLEGNWPWTMVSFMEEFSIANNKMYGKTIFNTLTFERQWQNMTVLNIANNKFTEEWSAVNEAYFPKILYFNVENNQFSGGAPALRGVRQYRIGGNFFSFMTDVSFASPPETEARTLSDCDMTNVPFRNAPPAWLKPISERCHYRYDPSNRIYKFNDFTLNPVTTSTTTKTNKTDVSTTETSLVITFTSEAKQLSSTLLIHSMLTTASATKTILSLGLFCFLFALY